MQTNNDTRASEFDPLDKSAPLNVMSAEDLSILREDVRTPKERSRPMTTRLGDRRMTQQLQNPDYQPFQQGAEEVQGIFERHRSPQKT